MIDEFLATSSYTRATKRTYTQILTVFEGEMQHSPAAPTAAQLVHWLDDHDRENGGKWGNARLNLALACVQSYLKSEYGSKHPALRAKIKRQQGKLQRAITQDQLLAILATFDTLTPKGARDLAMAALMSQAAFRAAEICRLRQEHVDTEHGVAQVLVKGAQWRVGIFEGETAQYIELWKRHRETLNPQDGRLFVSLKSKYVGKPLTPEGLNQIVRGWGRRIGIKLSPHDFRRGFATIGGENGAPDTLLMYGGGWHDQNAFNRYTRTARLSALRKFLPSVKVETNT